MVSVNEFPIATANEIPGFKIIETKGFVYGLTVRSKGCRRSGICRFTLFSWWRN